MKNHTFSASVCHFIKKEIVLSVSFILALLSVIWVKPDAAYLGYIDFRTLAILFSLMVVMAGFQKLGVFRQLGGMLIGKVHSVRGISLVFVLLCFFMSMFITNDVALITFVPFTIIVLAMADRNEALIPIIVLETIAANLGSMLLPMGNPQNLYLYSLADMPFGEFVRLILPYAAVALFLLIIANQLFLKKDGVSVYEEESGERSREDKLRMGMYLLLFLLSLLTVLRILDYRILAAIVVIAVLAADRRIFGRVDYSLLFTFLFLFIFIGNLKRIPAVSDFLSALVAGNEVIVSVLASQVISNVPAAILLSGFTDNLKGLLIGTNLGGLGTLIASMASLISFKQYANLKGAKKGRYLLVFTAANVIFLLILLGEYMALSH